MTTIVTALTGRRLEAALTLAERTFLDGECYAFALALHRGLGWPMVGLMDGKVIRHAAAQPALRTLQLYDVRGVTNLFGEEFGRPFGIKPPYDLREVSEEDLRAVRPIHERTIERAAYWAEVMWPHWPWKQGYAIRAKAFADDLEKLSRKHGLWIRSVTPTLRPVLARSKGDELGYTISMTDGDTAFTIDRRLTDA